MSIIKIKPTNYTVLPNETARDENLSADALGVLAYLLSHSENWTVRRTNLMRRFNMGTDKCRRIINELVDAGYMTFEQTRINGQMGPAEYVVGMIPFTENRSTDKRLTENPTLKKEQGLRKNNSKKEQDLYISRFEQFWKAFPKRAPHGNGSKSKAFSTFKTKIKNGARPEEIIAGARKYSRYVAGEDMEPQFICMAQTWLNQERWSDEVGEPETKRAIPDGGYIDYES